SRCWAVTHTFVSISSRCRNSSCTSGAILTASGRVPKTAITFSRPAGRSPCPLPRSPSYRSMASPRFALFRSEQPVAGVAEARHDVAVLVQMAVDGGHIDVHIRMFLLDGVDALGRRNQAHQLDLRAAALLQQGDGGVGGTARRQHRVDD